MIAFSNGGMMVSSVSELPEVGDITNLFLDVETTSGHPKIAALNPWRNCYLLGVAFTFDDARAAWYIPLDHQHGSNIEDVGAVSSYLRDLFLKSKRWINHNPKYDAHVLINDQWILPQDLDHVLITDTIVGAKLIDSDRQFKGGYGLDALSAVWLSEDISDYEGALKAYLGKNNKDYGAVPADIMGAYACQDVLTNRRLFKFEESRIPEQSQYIWNIEQQLTSVLLDIERVGLRVDPVGLQSADLMNTLQLLELEEQCANIAGWPFRPHVNGDCFDVLCNQYGLPVIEWTSDEEDEDGERAGNPSFSANALKRYRTIPHSPVQLLDLMIKYRKLHTLNSLFVRRYHEKQINGFLHSSYNQVVRTGRMSCKDPNAMQLSKAAKALILPHEDHYFVSTDASQIEFRLIAHYIQDEDVIQSYRSDPWTDFHQWVADSCNIKRRPAKTLNFTMAYGGGKDNVIGQLIANPDVVEQITELVAHLPPTEAKAAFDVMCFELSNRMFNTYHEKLPGLRSTAARAKRMIFDRGYVYTGFGRRRHIPTQKARIAFNSVVQGTAADIMKIKMVHLAKIIKRFGIRMSAQVHDELVLLVPQDADIKTARREILTELQAEMPPFELRVPLRWSWGESAKDWAEASESAVNADP